MHPLLKKSIPHIIAVVVFLLVAVLYCKPVLDGKVVSQPDVLGWKGMAQQSFEYKEKYGHFPLWTESMFSGMPTYSIALDATSKISAGYFFYLFTLGLPKPICFFFLACICFYILTQTLRINPLIGIFSSLAYGYSTFNAIAIAVGHDTQLFAIGFMPAVIASVIVILQRKYLLGAAMLSVFWSLQIGTQHLQMVYYTGLVVGIMVVCFLIYSWKQKTIASAVPGIAMVAASAILAFFANALQTLPLQEYAKDTMRGGKSELTPTDKSNKSKGGLDKDYAFKYSVGVAETTTILVPAAYGGGTMGKLITTNSKLADKMTELLGVPEETALQFANYFAYWGPQPGTAGPVYIGAVVCFLFILGCIFLKSWHKWWIITASIVGFVLAWGSHFAAINYFLFDHLPFYNKFRAPSMALTIVQLTFPLMAALGLDVLVNEKNKKDAWSKFKTTAWITGAVAAILVIFYFVADFKSDTDRPGIMQQLAGGRQLTGDALQQVNTATSALVTGLREDRQSLYAADMLRTLILIALAGALVFFFLKEKIKPIVLMGGILVLSTYDLIAIDRLYLNEDNFKEPADVESAFTATAADLQIKKDTEKGFRVFDEAAAQGPFNDSRSSYFHNSIGGYHPAKLALYQDIIENQLAKGNMMVYNMLNTKYFIQRNPTNGQPEARVNPNAFGPCWLVKSIHYVATADEEMKALDSINVRDTAIIRKTHASEITTTPVPDSSAYIKLVDNLNDKVIYDFSAATNQFAVFSEVYYDKGWNAFIDGKPAPYFRVDYILRGMPVPAGKHRIEFRFEPKSYTLGNTITVIISIVIYLLVIAAIYVTFRKNNGPNADTQTV